MTTLTPEETAATIGGAQQAIGGPAAGFGVFYELDKKNIDLSSGAPVAELKLNKPSVENAERRIGIEPTSSPAMQRTQNAQENADNQYNGIFRGNLRASADRSINSGRRFGHRANYRHSLPSQPATFPQQASVKNPLLRAEDRRRLHELRRTFDYARAQHTKRVSVNPENIPDAAKKRSVEQARDNGATNTPFGPTPEAMKKLGFSVEEQMDYHRKMLRAAFDKWSGALMDGSYIATPTPYKRS